MTEEKYPYLPAHVTEPKEVKKLFLVELPPTSRPTCDLLILDTDSVSRDFPRSGQHEAARHADFRILR